MFKARRFFCALLALALLAGMVSVAAAEPETAPSATVYTHDGRVTLIDGACTDAPVRGFGDAAAVVDSVLDQLGGDENTLLEPWRELTDAYGNRYYVFQQMFDNTTVLGGAVKVITDDGGSMIGLTSSIVANPAEPDAGEDISAGEAEQIVLEHAAQTRQPALAPVEGLTRRMILPKTLAIDIEAEDDEGSRYVWVVYTNNPDGSQTHSSDLPYLAHYVTMDGEYLYSLPTIIPGDEAGASGFDASYVFEFMESVNYTGYVDLSGGEELEISVDVMRDKRTGMYYLGNLERRIVVADCWEFLYNGNRVVLESSPDNLEWDQVGLLTLYNYCRAYDYYKAIGWEGGDGLGTPILVLNDYCDASHVPVNNAAYVGGYLGWQIFLASQGNDFSQCLDILAHEYTHCVTGSVMTYNAYQNDFGAINEAVSDIQGKTCQMMMEGAENASWILGDGSEQPVRSMSDPHLFSQPEFTWDIYYKPRVNTPTLLNDQGGVHSNSSLLNSVAWRLYEKGGMTLEEGRAFWFTVDCAMVPGTDYAQLAELLPWALRASGLERYGTELRRALDATRLGVEDLPQAFDDDRALLTLRLPETETFADEQWTLSIISVDVDLLIGTALDIIGRVKAGDLSDMPPFIQELFGGSGDPVDDRSFPEILLGILLASDGEAAEGEAQLSLEDIRRQLGEWVREHFGDVFYASDTNAGQDGHTMRMVCRTGHALPVLIHGVPNRDASALEDYNMLLYIGGQWVDIFGVEEDQEMDEETKERISEAIANVESLDDVLDLLFYRIDGGMVNVLPETGLDTMEPVSQEMDISELTGQEAPERRKSRPKLDAAQDAA